MKRSSFVAISIGALATLSCSTNLEAQYLSSSPAHIGIMGGATFPGSSQFPGVTKSGWNAGALITLGVPEFPLSFRVDGQWHDLGGKARCLPDVGCASSALRVVDGTADFQWSAGRPSSSSLYLIAGIGMYHLRGRNVSTPGNVLNGSDTTITLTANKFGWNAGAGVQFHLSKLSLFVEGRYHSVSGGHDVDASGSTRALHIIPVDVGITL